MTASKPLALIQWENTQPKLCYTCAQFDIDTSHCAKGDGKPPDEIQKKPGLCRFWVKFDAI